MWTFSSPEKYNLSKIVNKILKIFIETGILLFCQKNLHSLCKKQKLAFFKTANLTVFYF